MVDAISGILGQSSSGNLHSKPHIWVDLSNKHWIPPILEQQRATDPCGNCVKNIPAPQVASIQQYLLYRHRFCVAVDLAWRFDSFGGNIGQVGQFGSAVTPFRHRFVRSSDRL